MRVKKAGGIVGDNSYAYREFDPGVHTLTFTIWAEGKKFSGQNTVTIVEIPDADGN